MKTIYGTFTRSKKEYPFNIIEDVNVGDIVHANEYDTPICVTKVLDQVFMYFNYKSPELSNLPVTSGGEIKLLTLKQEE